MSGAPSGYSGKGAGKGKKGSNGKGGSGKSGKGDDAPLSPCVGTVRLCLGDGASASPGMRLSADGCVLGVKEGSPSAHAGVLAGMRVTAVNGKPVGTPAEMRAAAGAATAFDLSVSISSAGKLSGVVSSWRPEKGIGFICPDVPLFNGDDVSTGDVFFHSSAVWNGRSAAVGQKVVFKVSLQGGRYKAVKVTSEDGQAPKAFEESSDTGVNGGGGLQIRAGADVATVVAKFGGNPTDQVCMRHCAGRCTVGKRCAAGLHIDRNFNGNGNATAGRSAGEPQAEEESAVEFVSVNNLGEANTLVFTAASSPKLMVYTNNGAARPEFDTMEWDGGLIVDMSSGRRARLTPENQARVLDRLRRLADRVGVRHNFPAAGPSPAALASNAPPVEQALNLVSATKLELLQQFVNDACKGASRPLGIQRAWQLKNDGLAWKFRCTEHNFARRDGAAPDVIDGFHGTSEANVLSIATTGFDPFRRSGQVYGAGEYFAQNPHVSVGYCAGGSFMFICKLILGTAGVDHDWIPSTKYYIMKQNEGNVQALPMYLIQYKAGATGSPLLAKLAEFKCAEHHAEEIFNRMGQRQRGGVLPEKGRVDGGMSAAATKCLWVGWIDRDLGKQSDEALLEDMAEFLKPHAIKRARGERNGARLGAFVELRDPVSRFVFAELNTRLYRGKHRVSVDDAQPCNPRNANRSCPRLSGPGRFCRAWNLRGHRDWTEACSFKHSLESFPTYDAAVSYAEVTGAKLHEISRLFGSVGIISKVQRIVNKAQEEAYESRRAFLSEKGGAVLEKDLWHGTNAAALDTILKRGVQCPSDTKPSPACGVSGGKNLCTTLCGTDCEHCIEPHEWNLCHMFGLGVYLADDAQKSDRYVVPDGNGRRAMIRCRVNLGSPYRIEANLLDQRAMHDFVRCEDPAALVDQVHDTWDTAKAHDSYYIKGLGGRAKPGYGCINSEYVVFHPSQVLPMYVVYY